MARAQVDIGYHSSLHKEVLHKQGILYKYLFLGLILCPYLTHTMISPGNNHFIYCMKFQKKLTITSNLFPENCITTCVVLLHDQFPALLNKLQGNCLDVIKRFTYIELFTFQVQCTQILPQAQRKPISSTRRRNWLPFGNFPGHNFKNKSMWACV